MASSVLPTVDLGEKGNVQVAQSLVSEGTGRARHRRRVRSIAVEQACGIEGSALDSVFKASLATSCSLLSLPLILSRSTLYVNTDGIDGGNMLVDTGEH